MAMYDKLVDVTYLDIKRMVVENPNDMDLGRKIRTYVLNIEKYKEQLKKEEQKSNEDIQTSI
jgi:hypothetical protein